MSTVAARLPPSTGPCASFLFLGVATCQHVHDVLEKLRLDTGCWATGSFCILTLFLAFFCGCALVSSSDWLSTSSELRRQHGRESGPGKSAQLDRHCQPLHLLLLRILTESLTFPQVDHVFSGPQQQILSVSFERMNGEVGACTVLCIANCECVLDYFVHFYSRVFQAYFVHDSLRSVDGINV